MNGSFILRLEIVIGKKSKPAPPTTQRDAVIETSTLELVVVHIQVLLPSSSSSLLCRPLWTK